MSAPEVRIESGGAPVYWWSCDTCHRAGATHTSRDAAEQDRVTHATQCGDLARLQARWDARNEALRGLIEQWRTAPERIGSGRMAIGYAAGRTDSADELERAIGDGRG